MVYYSDDYIKSTASYQLDEKNRVLKVTATGSLTATDKSVYPINYVETYTYDAAGHKTSHTVQFEGEPSRVNNYVWKDNNLIEESDNSSTIQYTYTTTPNLPSNGAGFNYGTPNQNLVATSTTVAKPGVTISGTARASHIYTLDKNGYVSTREGQYTRFDGSSYSDKTNYTYQCP